MMDELGLGRRYEAVQALDRKQGIGFVLAVRSLG